MNFGACIGLPEAIDINIRDESYRQNNYAGKDFFEDENFRAALERMNGGYEIDKDLIQMMDDYCQIDRIRAQNMRSFSKKWIQHLKNQSTISSYHTTKRAQLDTIRSAKKFARIDDKRCDNLQTIINEYHNVIDQTYVRVNFGHRYEHRRMREFKKLFKEAHATLAEWKRHLDKLSTQKNRIEHTLLQVDKTLEEDMTEKKRINKMNVQSKYEIELKILEERVIRAKKDYTIAKQIYRNKAKEIFSQCQQVEQQRLEQIREILLKFIQMMHTRNYTTEIEQIYDELISNVTTQQNSLDDLTFWAKTYGILDDEVVSSSFTNFESQILTNNEHRDVISSVSTESIASGNEFEEVETEMDKEKSSTQ